MRRSVSVSCLTLGLLCGLATAPAARAEDKKADEILKEIDAVKMPEVPPVAQRRDRAAMLKFVTERQEAMKKQADLIGELYKADPKNPKLKTLLPQRWQALMSSPTGIDNALKSEIDAVADHSEDAALKTEALFWRVAVAFRSGQADSPETKKAAEAFFQAAPKDERGSQILAALAGQSDDPAKQSALYKRILKDYPDSPSAKMVEGKLKRLDSVGKPFDLEFTDAVKGSEVSMKTLKGKVVVVDFWATWCGPCVAEMPNMKKLYAEYKDKGVEFIGVSLDQPKEAGGLDALKKFVAEHEITWPQYYQGKGWESDFSRSWGINSIPAVFVVDADGKLYSLEARGKLDKLIPELLNKPATPKAGAGTEGR